MPDPYDPLGYLALVSSLRERTYAPTLTQPEEASPGLGLRLLHGLGTVVGASKSATDALMRASLRSVFDMEVPEDYTTGRALREAAGLSVEPEAGQLRPEAAGYAERLAGGALEFGGNLVTDPLLPAMGLVSRAPAVARAASAGFAGLMGAGAVEEGQRLAETVGREGFTPQAAEEALGTGLSGLFALGAAGHALSRRPVPASARPEVEPVQPADQPGPPEVWAGGMPPEFRAPTIPPPPRVPPFPETAFRPEAEPFQVPVDVMGELVPSLPVLAARGALERRPVVVQGEIMPERPALAPLGLEEPAYEGQVIPRSLEELALLQSLRAPRPALPEPVAALPEPAPAPRRLPAPVESAARQGPPDFDVWAREQGLTVDPGNRAGLVQEWLREHPDVTDAQRAAMESAVAPPSIPARAPAQIKAALEPPIPQPEGEILSPAERGWSVGPWVDRATGETYSGLFTDTGELHSTYRTVAEAQAIFQRRESLAEVPEHLRAVIPPEHIVKSGAAIPASTLGRAPAPIEAAPAEAARPIEQATTEVRVPEELPASAVDTRPVSSGPTVEEVWGRRLAKFRADIRSGKKTAELRGVYDLPLNVRTPAEAIRLMEQRRAYDVAVRAHEKRAARPAEDAEPAFATRPRATVEDMPAEFRESLLEESQRTQERAREREAAVGEAVRQRFGKIAETVQDADGWRVRFKDGLGDLLIRADASGIDLLATEAVAGRLGREAKLSISFGGPGATVHGVTTKIGRDALIRLRDGNVEPLGHEELHALLKLGRARPAEIDALWREHGYRRTGNAEADQRAFSDTEERVAGTLGRMIRERVEAEVEGRRVAQPHWFERLWTMLKRAVNVLRGRGETFESARAKEAVASGEVYRRGAEEPRAPVIGEGTAFAARGTPRVPASERAEASYARQAERHEPDPSKRPEWIEKRRKLTALKHEALDIAYGGAPGKESEVVSQIRALEDELYGTGRGPTTRAPGEQPKFATAPASAAPGQQPRISLPDETLVQRADRLVADKFSRLRTAVRTVGAAGGRTGAGEEALGRIERFGGLVANQIETAETRFVDPLVKGLAQSRTRLEDLGDYMALLHKPTRDTVIAQRTNGQVTEGSGWTAGDATTRWAELEQRFGRRNAQGRIASLEPLADHVRQMRDEQLRVLEDGGLISAQQAQSWRATMGDDYVPLRTAEVTEGLGTGRGFDIRGREAKAATGRSTKADNPVVFMAQQLNRAIIRAEKNRADQQFADFVRDNNLFDMDKAHERTELDSKGQVRKVRDALADQQDFHYKVNGETHRITITDPLLDRAMKNLSAEETGQFVRVIGGLTRAYSALVTSYNPEFIFTNFARDIQTAVANVSAEQGSKIAGAVVKNVPQAMKGMADALYRPQATGKWADLAREFREDGGPIGFYQLKDAAALGRELEGRITAAGPGALNASRRAMQAVARHVSNANKVVENGTRLALYGALREAGVPRGKAAVAARRVTVNFEQKGELGTFFNSLWAFSNAGIQGTKRLAQVALFNPTGRKVALGIVGAGFALDQYNRATAQDWNNDGTNDWDDVPEFVKERNLVIMRPDGKPPFLFPLPWGFNMAVTIGRLASAVTAGVPPAKAGASLASAAWNAFNPVGGESDVVQALAPTFLDPIVQHEMNRDFAGRPLMPEQRPGEARKPQSELYFRSVPPMARELAGALNRATGGDKRTPGFIDVSPEIIDHYFGWMTGGLGRFAENLTSTAEAVASGERPELRRIPFVRRFAYEAPESATGMKYREALQELTDVYGRFRGYAQDRNQGGVQGMMRDPETRGLLAAYEFARRAEAQIKKLRDAARQRPDLEERMRPQIEALQKAVLRQMAQVRRKAA